MTVIESFAARHAMRLARLSADRIFALEASCLPLPQLAELARRALRSDRHPGPAMLDALALASIAAHRSLGLRPHLPQLAAAMLLLQGRAAELAAGEGKTLALALAAAAHALSGRPVHLVLDGRLSPSVKAGMMAPLFAVLGISVGAIADGAGNPGARARREGYQADVCYVGADDVMRDFAGDCPSSEGAGLRQPETVIALIDDIDTVLIDAVAARRAPAGTPIEQHFRRYRALGGLSATLVEARRELAAVYGLQVTAIASIYPCFRSDLGLRVLGSRGDWRRAVVARVRQLASTRRPVLVAAESVPAAGELVAALREAGVDAALAADSYDRSGNPGRVTVGVHFRDRLQPVVLDPLARAAGGLAVIATYVPESRRADRQLGHLTGRNGQPGSMETIAALPLPGLLARLPGPLMRSLARTRRYLGEKRAERSRRQAWQTSLASLSSQPAWTDPVAAPRQPAHLQHQGR
jgi:preprotein translocase subunit SecA